MKYTISRHGNTLRLETSESSDEVVEIKHTSSTSVQRGFPNPLSRRKMADEFRDFINQNPVAWITPGYQKWKFDLGNLRQSFPVLKSIDWLVGIVAIEPEFETGKPYSRTAMEAHLKRSGMELPPFEYYEGKLVFTIAPELIAQNLRIPEAPIEIQESLKRFKFDYPDPRKVAFVIMRFGESMAHIDIDAGIKEGLKKYGLTGLRADERQYHDDLFQNVLTFMHGCGFGVAVFERIEEESFNPNISLEVGYMMALGKPVCILKDRTLKTLHSDLVGKLYRVFDPLNAGTTIQEQIYPWLKDKGFV